jgi:hypothetical protein
MDWMDGATDFTSERVVMYCDVGEWLECVGAWEGLLDGVV